MCTYIVKKAELSGSAKGPNGWFHMNQANVCFDHPFHAQFGHSLNIDFVNESEGVAARVAVEMSAESARELVKAIQAALEIGEAANVA